MTLGHSYARMRWRTEKGPWFLGSRKPHGTRKGVHHRSLAFGGYSAVRMGCGKGGKGEFFSGEACRDGPSGETVSQHLLVWDPIWNQLLAIGGAVRMSQFCLPPSLAIVDAEGDDMRAGLWPGILLLSRVLKIRPFKATLGCVIVWTYKEVWVPAVVGMGPPGQARSRDTHKEDNPNKRVNGARPHKGPR